MNEKQVIDCSIDFIRKANCLPTTKQLAQVLGVSEAEIDKFKQENADYAEFVKIRKRFTGSDDKRKKGFGDFEAFYKWYVAQGDKCYYCGTTQKELNRLFDDELVSSSKFGATLHIERVICFQAKSQIKLTMKTKVKFVSITLKVALLGMMAFAFAGCGEGKEEWYSKLPPDEFWQLADKCWLKNVKQDCQTLIDNGLPSLKQCAADNICIIMGGIYENAENHKQALEYYNKGCEFGENNGSSCNSAGILYVKGLGVRQDRSIAKEYFGKACDFGDKNGCSNYKRLNEQGVK